MPLRIDSTVFFGTYYNIGHFENIFYRKETDSYCSL